MTLWSEEEFLRHMQREPWFTPGAIAVSQGILDWASIKHSVSTYWSGEVVPIFNASASGKRFISIMAKKGWDLEIPFHDHWQGYLLERSKNQQAIARLQQIGIKTVKPQPLSPDNRHSIRLDSISPCLEQFLELLDWMVNEIYQNAN